MSKHKVKGTKIDLRTLGDATAAISLPKGPAARAADDEGKFRRSGKGGGGYDRDRNDRNGFGGDRGDRGGFGDRDRSDGGGGWRGGGGGSSGGFGGSSEGRRPLNLTSSRAPLNNNGPAPGGGLFGRPAPSGGATPPPAPQDKWSKLENSMGSRDEAPQGGGRFSNLRDSDRPGGQFGRNSGPPDVRSNSRFGFVNDEPREGPPRSNDGGFGRRDDGPTGDYRGAAMQPSLNAPAGDAASQVAINKQQTEIAEKTKAEEKAARAQLKAERKAAEEAAKLAEKEAKKAAKAAKKEAERVQTEMSNSIVASGEKGAKLVESLKAKGDDIPSPKAFVTAVLTASKEPTGLAWTKNDEYGAAIKFLCSGKGSIQKQAGVVYGCQAFYYGLKYPRTNESDGKRESLISRLFYHLFNSDLIEEEAFNEWRYADDDEKDAPGKKDALFQLSEFLNYLDEPAEEDEDEEEEPVTFERVELRSK